MSGCLDAWMCGWVGGHVGARVLGCMIARARGRAGAWIGYGVWLSGA